MVNPKEEDIVFGATLHHVKTLRNILKALTIVEDVIFEVDHQGVRITVEEGHCLQASLFMPQEWFAEYYVKPTEDLTQAPISFAVNLTSLTGCLKMTSDDDCKLIIIYCGDIYPLVLAFSGCPDSNIAIEAELKTKIFRDTLNFHHLAMPPDYNRIIMNKASFSDLFSEIDVSSGEIEMLLSPQEPYFLLRATTGKIQAETTVQVAKTSNSFVSFRCTHSLKLKYRSSHIRFANKCLAFAHSVALTVYTTGLLSIEILLVNSNPDTTTARRGSATTLGNIPVDDSSMGVLKYFIT
uniref:Checkpoint protein n=2 Tax=Phlebotomus papatasi TaxID=29031 RepID=A0A1B0D9A6_PHLPP